MRQLRSVSAPPIPSTSTASQSPPPPPPLVNRGSAHAHFQTEAGSRATSYSNHGLDYHSRPVRRRRASSTAPLLQSHLHSHSFTAENHDLPGLPLLEKKHAATTALTRIFIGAHRVGDAEKGKVLSAERDANKRPDLEASSSSESSSSSSEDESDFDAGEGGVDSTRLSVPGQMAQSQRQQIRLTNKFDKRMRRNQATSGYSAGSDVTAYSSALKSGGSLQKWIGGSFEIGGDVKEASERRKLATQQKAATAAASGMGGAGFFGRRGSGASGARNLPPGITFTPPPLKSDYSPADPPARIENAMPDLAHRLLRRNSDTLIAETTSLHSPAASKDLLTSKTPVVAPKTSPLIGLGFPSSSPRTAPPSIQTLPVTFSADSRAPALSPIHSVPGDQPPHRVEEVLARTLEPRLAGTKKKVAFPARLRHPSMKDGRNEVVRKERMLVRVGWTEREDVPANLDEQSAIKYKTTNKAWQEFAVVWRTNRIELYTDSAFTWLTGQPKLAHIIPITPRSHTTQSLYSSPDLVFCLTHRRTPSTLHTFATSRGGAQSLTTKFDDGDEAKAKKAVKGGYVHFRHTGTNIFIFRARTHAIATEWMWHIHRSLHSPLPQVVDVVVPILRARIRLPIPDELPPGHFRSVLDDDDEGKGEAYRLMTPRAVTKVCMDQLEKVREWKEVLNECVKEGIEMKLVWRRGEILDWVRDAETEWAVMAGFVLDMPHFIPSLELRPAMHYPTTVRTPSGPNAPAIRLAEPPSLEGYLTRIKPNGTQERVYLSTHNSNMFLCRPSTAFPPDPPVPAQDAIRNPAVLVLAPILLGFASVGKDERPAKAKAWDSIIARTDGVFASRDQSRSSSARSAKSVRTRINVDPDASTEETDVYEKWRELEKKRLRDQLLAAKGFVSLDDVVSIERMKKEGGADEEILLDSSDVGGQKGLSASGDTATLRRQRTFVLTTSNGHQTKFECFSIAVASEWIGRLNALRTYWKARNRLDAIEQMELLPWSSMKATPRRDAYPQKRDKHGNRDLDDSFPLLPKIYNWCVLDTCRAVIQSGRVYVKNGIRDTFRQRFLFLIQGSLVECETKRRNFNSLVTANAFHRRKGAISLRGCYVYSGRVSGIEMGESAATSWDPAAGQPRFARLYGEDGLRTSDDEEDCTLVIYKKSMEARQLGSHGSLTIIRCRSMLERDEWLYSLNAAISELRKMEESWEEKLKEFPWLKKKRGAK